MSEPFRIRFNPDQPLAEFIKRDYLPVAGRRRRYKSGKPISPCRVQQLEHWLRVFKAYLHRVPIVADVTPEVLREFQAWHREGWPTQSGGWLRINCDALLRFIKLLPDQRGRNGRAPRELSEAPHTLWGICVAEYFPKNLRIQSPQTMKQYRIAVADFAEMLGRDPLLTDLTDDNVILLVRSMTKKGLANRTANERASRIKAVWTWCAKKRKVDDFPFVPRLKVPRRIPQAWSRDQLGRIFASCRQEEGQVVPGIASRDWWLGLHWVQWSTGERIGALLALRWDWIDERGCVEIPAEHRKGGFEDFLHRLRPEALAAIAKLRPAGYDQVFPWEWTQVTFYKHLKGILRRAGLPFDRRCMTHKMRRSVASHLQAQGINASLALGHSTEAVTREAYLDPRIVNTPGPAVALFNPEEIEVAVALLPEPQPKRLTQKHQPD